MVYEDDTTEDFQLERFEDSNNTVKLSWDDLNIEKAKRVFFHSRNTMTHLLKFDINKIDVTDLSGFVKGNTYLLTLDATKTWDTSGVTDMSEMFCETLISNLDLSNFDTSHVKNMTGMFSECRQLQSLDISNFDTSNVTDMNHMFTSNESLISLDLSNFETSKVTNMCSLFSNCCSLDSIDVSSFDTSNVTDMSYMFNNCECLKNLNLLNFNTSKVTKFTNILSNCPAEVLWGPDGGIR